MEKSEVQDIALEAILPRHRCGIDVSMGVGKTLIGLRYLGKQYTDYCKFLIVANKLSTFDSWREETEKFGLAYLLDHITFTTYLSLDKQDTDYDVVIFDEAHNLLLSHDFWISNYHGKILGMSGTMPKYKTSEKGKMVQKYCPVVYTYKTDEAVEDDILNDYEIIVHTLPLDTNKTIFVERGDKSWYASEQSIYTYWSGRIDEAATAKALQIARIMRMKAMMEFPSKERLAISLGQKINAKCIIFANTMQQADRLCNYSYHSQNENSEYNLREFKEGNIQKLSCVLQLSEGVNIPYLKESIILHAYGNERKLSQRLGRCLRLNPDDKATINILCYAGTVDVEWVTSALSNFDKTKIKYI